MDTQKTVETARNIAARTAGWGKRTFTPRRLKKGACCLLVLAALGSTGKFAAHQAKAAARLQEAQARTTMLQNLAARRNITLVSTDQVKENIASALGVDASEINFRSVTLDDRKPGDKKNESKKKEKRDKTSKEQKQKKEGKENRNKNKQFENKNEPRRPPMPPQAGQQNGATPQGTRPEGQPGLTPNDQPPMPPQNGMKPEGQPQNGQPPVMQKAASTERPFAAPAPQQMKKTKRFPGVYLADCEKDGMRYHFIVDAQSGEVLRGQVHKMNPLLTLFS